VIATGPVSETVPEAPPEAMALFGERLPLAERYAARLAGDGVLRGLIGPREVPRLWARHLVNCAVVTDLLPEAAAVLDVGSGAGLPGLAMAIRRPDLSVVLLEPMARRVGFLDEVVGDLGLGDQVSVERARAEELGRRSIPSFSWIVARAVAPLGRLAQWCVPLLSPGGTLLAMKGERAGDEVAEHTALLRAAGVVTTDIVRCGQGVVSEPVTVVRLVTGPRRKGSK
jgi:16S rRNA (guanine527-N7)-methyltransferase